MLEHYHEDLVAKASTGAGAGGDSRNYPESGWANFSAGDPHPDDGNGEGGKGGRGGTTADEKWKEEFRRRKAAAADINMDAPGNASPPPPAG